MSNSHLLGKSPGNFWPPRGWEQLGLIKKLEGQAILKNPAHATITGLFFKIDPVPVYLKNNQRGHVYRISVDGWSYSIYNESHEFNIISFDLADRLTRHLSKENCVSNIKIKSRPLVLNKRSAGRSYMAALLLMKQIESGIVPDYDRVLRLYKIHPSQRSLYEQDIKRKTSLNCGLKPYCLETLKIEELSK